VKKGKAWNMTGIVKQLDGIGGVVVECSRAVECMAANPDLSQAPCSTYPGAGRVRKCILTGNPDHGNRCAAYPQDTTSWIIDENPQNIKQILTNDGIKR
jgi:hypothetical protein